MSNDDDDLDESTSPDQLRELKQEMHSRIEAIGILTGALNQKIEDAEKIRKYCDFLKDIEAKLATYDKGAS